MTRYEIINHFILRRGYTRFLEIGTAGGDTYRNVCARVRISVDPDRTTMATYRMTSDEFFELTKIYPSAEGEMDFDIIFIDGLHTCDQAYADIMNALGVLNPGGVIVIHDCLPSSEQMQLHAESYPGGIWTGDVWKAFVKARTELPYLMYTIDTDFGCGIIDTAQKRSKIPPLPTDMNKMSYEDYNAKKQAWMNVKGGIQNGG